MQNDLHEASEKRESNNMDYNWAAFLFIGLQNGLA